MEYYEERLGKGFGLLSRGLIRKDQRLAALQLNGRLGDLSDLPASTDDLGMHPSVGSCWWKKGKRYLQ